MEGTTPIYVAMTKYFEFQSIILSCHDVRNIWQIQLWFCVQQKVALFTAEGDTAIIFFIDDLDSNN